MGFDQARVIVREKSHVIDLSISSFLNVAILDQIRLFSFSPVSRKQVAFFSRPLDFGISYVSISRSIRDDDEISQDHIEFYSFLRLLAHFNQFVAIQIVESFRVVIMNAGLRF